MGWIGGKYSVDVVVLLLLLGTMGGEVDEQASSVCSRAKYEEHCPARSRRSPCDSIIHCGRLLFMDCDNREEKDTCQTLKLALLVRELIKCLVAEMHGELIEFNERLHRALVAKEALVSQMRQELIDLRGPPLLLTAPPFPLAFVSEDVEEPRDSE
ncbi:Sorting nexin-29 [Tupaia chinensis]|uniref:Sorting nexin-29 n=1 Tax=Tupaia chinensis TaxID=246437 RepID=L9KXJ6_TUPCH|nr:Sorting nexin-29 [Tupaia chinensis]